MPMGTTRNGGAAGAVRSVLLSVGTARMAETAQIADSSERCRDNVALVLPCLSTHASRAPGHAVGLGLKST